MGGYLQYRAAEVVSRLVPRSWAYRISTCLADRNYRRDAEGRQAVIENLRRVFEHTGHHLSEAELQAAARETFRLFGKYIVDFFFFPSLTREWVARMVVVEHLEYVEQARGLGRGVLLVTAHFGNWELGGAVLTALGHSISVVALSQPDQRLDRFFQEYRRRRGMRSIPLGRAVRGILEVLGRGEAVALLADRDYTLRNDCAVLFGAPARLPRGPAWLASHTGAPIVPGFLVRRPDDTYRLRFHPPIVPTPETSLLGIQERICRVLEEEIGAHPHQWYMFRPMWGGKAYGGAGRAGQEPERQGGG